VSWLFGELVSWCLVFGVWCLVFGVWCLVFGELVSWCLVIGLFGELVFGDWVIWRRSAGDPPAFVDEWSFCFWFVISH